MPWNKDDEGGGQGPWGGGNRDNPRNRNNWGGGNRGPNGPGNLPPELDELIRRGKDQFKNAIPGGGGRFSWLIPVALFAAFAVYNSVYQVQPDERGVVLRLGEFNRVVDPGLQFALWPIERIEKPRVGTVRQINIGADQNEGQMLTSDKNIITVPFTVQWRISSPKDFLFNVADQERTISALAQSAMREVAAQKNAQLILTTGKDAIAQQVLQITQSLLDKYNAGVTVTAVNLGDVQPPAEVADAFADVVRAEQNNVQLENEAKLYRNQKTQEALGQVAKLNEDAEGYKTRVIAEARGEAARFLSVYEQYKNAKDVTRQRLFLETMESVLSQSNKVIVESSPNGQGVVPYLPLPQIQKPAGQ
ncbi:MAG: FtsH protease activity modulator HflK [Phyllobacteriaceae bacterium]|nr:FtsH protease activity modulator HflK [Phyllobacteriaceae bacterium]